MCAMMPACGQMHVGAGSLTCAHGLETCRDVARHLEISGRAAPRARLKILHAGVCHRRYLCRRTSMHLHRVSSGTVVGPRVRVAAKRQNAEAPPCRCTRGQACDRSQPQALGARPRTRRSGRVPLLRPWGVTHRWKRAMPRYEPDFL
jgi:hypothetical protein